MHRPLSTLLVLSLPTALVALSGCAKVPAPTADGSMAGGAVSQEATSIDDAPVLAGVEEEAPAPTEVVASRLERVDADARAEVEDLTQPAPPPMASPAAEPQTAQIAARSRHQALSAPARLAAAAPAKAKKAADANAAAVGGAAGVLAQGPSYPPGQPRGGITEAQTRHTAPIDAQVHTEEYTDHGINPYTVAADDRHSTFSIDVDTAAYAVARRKLNEGSLPPEAAVRVEEFINFFDYPSYTQPSSGPFAVHLDAMPDPFRPGHHTVRVGVQGKELSQADRPPLHLTFLVDVSGSMSSEDKLGLAKKSMHMLVDGLREEDTVALATYAGQVARILEPTRAMHKRQIHDAIDRLGAGGSTAMSAGIDLAYGMAMQSFRPGHENRVVILSDGDANVGASSWDGLLAQIKQYADKGVTLSTIGLGMGNYRDTLMEQLANKGDGNNFYIDSQAQAQRVFVEELGGSMLTIARDVKIQVEFNPAVVSAYRLVGYENRDIADKDFRNDRVDAGEVGSGHDVTAIYDVILKDGYASDLATVRMRWEAPGADKAAQEQAWALPARALHTANAMAQRDTQITYAAATFAEVLRGSPTAAEIRLEALIRYARAAARPGQKDDAELITLMEKAHALGAGSRGQALTLR